MKFFPWQKAADLFSAEEKKFIVDAVQYNESRTSGEIRVFVESYCKYVDAIDRAAVVKGLWSIVLVPVETLALFLV